ncbi:MAG: hypothetical protein ACRD2J_14405 [Thermoanaerobaculia bacterium]
MTASLLGRLPMSRGFLAALGGIAITIYAWFSSSLWPAWPSLAVFPLVDDFLDPSSRYREAVVVVLIAVNIGGWAVVLYVLGALTRRMSRHPE